MQIKENTSIHPGKISLGVGRYGSGVESGKPTRTTIVRTIRWWWWWGGGGGGGTQHTKEL